MRVSWSRRRVLTEGVLSLAVALSLPRAIGRARAARPPRAGRPAGATPPASAAGGSGTLPSASEFGGRMTTALRINGYGPYRFLVDTGAERTVIADDLADRLALPHGPEVLVEGIVRGERARLVEIRELEMGSLLCPRLEVPALPRSMLNADGYLGLDVLDGRRVVFDFLAGTITVAKPQGFFSALWTRWTRTDEVRIRTLGDSGRLRATHCSIDGVEADAFIDSGAEASVINQELYAALQRHTGLRSELSTETLTGITGGSVVGATTMLNMVRVGDMVMTFTVAVIADLPVFKLWHLNQRPALLIGMDCLRRCARVSIDYGRKELHFELASTRLPQPLEAALQRPLPG